MAEETPGEFPSIFTDFCSAFGIAEGAREAVLEGPGIQHFRISFVRKGEWWKMQTYHGLTHVRKLPTINTKVTEGEPFLIIFNSPRNIHVSNWVQMAIRLREHKVKQMLAPPEFCGLLRQGGGDPAYAGRFRLKTA